EAEIADQAAATIAVGLEPSGDDVEVAPQARARRQRRVLERLSDEAAGDVEVAIEHLGSKHLLGAEMVGEGPLRCARRSGDVAHAGAVIAGLEHDLEAGVEDGVFERGLGHERIIRTYVLKSSAVLSLRQSACQSVGYWNSRWIERAATGSPSGRGLAARDHPIAQPRADGAADEIAGEHHEAEVEPVAET